LQSVYFNPLPNNFILTPEPMFREIGNKFIRYTLIFIFSVIIFFCALQLNFLWLFGYSPSYHDIKAPTQRVGSELYTADGKLIGRYFKENRTPVDFKEISPSVINALIATEDVRFYQHMGIDFRSLLSSGISTATGDKRGASTITQQLAKNLYRTRYNKAQGLTGKIPIVRTIVTKFKEWMTAVKLESNYSKNDIITMYLNTVSFGNNAYGIKTAARTYFDRETQELTVPESAMLVGMLKGTTLYNPIRNPKNALERRNVALAQMAKYNYISNAAYNVFKDTPISLKAGDIEESSDGDSYLRAAVAKYLEKWCTDNNFDLYEDGLKIYTTIDSKLQTYAEEAVADHMKILQKRFYSVWGKEDPWYDSEKKKVDYPDRAMRNLRIYSALEKKFPNQPDSVSAYFNKKKKMKVFSWNGTRDTLFSTLDSIRYYGKILNTGMMTLDPFSGKIKVWVGGVNHRFFKYDHVNQAKRQAGSTFKPFAYLAALENGMSPCDTYIDKPVKISYNNKGKTEYWEPRNASWGNTYQTMSLRLAMARSVNTITAQVTEDVGWDNVVKWAHECGIESPLQSVPSVSLGPNDVSVFEMVKAYGTFLNKGVKTDPILVEKITDLDDNTIEDFKPKTTRVLSEEIAWLMLYMLRGGMEEPGGTSQALWEWDLWKKNNQIGGKTGTSSDYVDAWYMGVTKDLVTGVWVGCDERTAHFKNGETGEGSRTALPIFAKFMEKVYRDPKSGYTFGQFPKPTVEITRKYNCPAPRYVPDTTENDSTIIDSLEVEPFPEEQTQTEQSQETIGTDNKPTPDASQPKPVATEVPLTRKEERELRKKKRQEEKEARMKP
jgi:penicillin-binding protein 1A